MNDMSYFTAFEDRCSCCRNIVLPASLSGISTKHSLFRVWSALAVSSLNDQAFLDAVASINFNDLAGRCFW